MISRYSRSSRRTVWARVPVLSSNRTHADKQTESVWSLQSAGFLVLDCTIAPSNHPEVWDCRLSGLAKGLKVADLKYESAIFGSLFSTLCGRLWGLAVMDG